jgi:hypothetical protein
MALLRIASPASFELLKNFATAKEKPTLAGLAKVGSLKKY